MDKRMGEGDKEVNKTLIQELRVCRRCLTREMMGEQGEYFKNLHEYIANLDEELKAAPLLYEKRLAACKECSLLYQGMCRTCGCYVELRAAIARNGCPDKKW